MVKEHNIRMMISNESGFPMTRRGEWYDSGRLGDSYSWPSRIQNGDHCDIMNYERDWALAGCSGYVQYEIGGDVVTFAFSNPSVGCNKLGVGTGGKDVWDKMDNHDYKPFVVQVQVDRYRHSLDVVCHCTGGSTNMCIVTIYRAPDWNKRTANPFGSWIDKLMEAR